MELGVTKGVQLTFTARRMCDGCVLKSDLLHRVMSHGQTRNLNQVILAAQWSRLRRFHCADVFSTGASSRSLR
jgi:predicted phosphoadenosine phosphosulfate sulfurtransferase